MIFKRFIAYFIDILIVTILVTVVNDSRINPNYDNYINSSNKYTEYSNSYYKMKYVLPNYYSDQELNDTEYQNLLKDNDTFSYLLVERYEDGILDNDEYKEIKEIVNKDYEDNYKDIYYDYEKNNIFYYIIYIVMFLLYFVGFNLITNGATLGKKICHFKIVSIDDKKVKWYNYLIRSVILYNLIFALLRVGVILFIQQNSFLNIMKSIYFLDIVFSYIILFSILFNKDKIGIHDKLAKTKVESVK